MESECDDGNVSRIALQPVSSNSTVNQNQNNTSTQSQWRPVMNANQIVLNECERQILQSGQNQSSQPPGRSNGGEEMMQKRGILPWSAVQEQKLKDTVRRLQESHSREANLAAQLRQMKEEEARQKRKTCEFVDILEQWQNEERLQMRREFKLWSEQKLQPVADQLQESRELIEKMRLEKSQALVRSTKASEVESKLMSQCEQNTDGIRQLDAKLNAHLASDVPALRQDARLMQDSIEVLGDSLTTIKDLLTIIVNSQAANTTWCDRVSKAFNSGTSFAREGLSENRLQKATLAIERVEGTIKKFKRSTDQTRFKAKDRDPNSLCDINVSEVTPLENGNALTSTVPRKGSVLEVDPESASSQARPTSTDWCTDQLDSKRFRNTEVIHAVENHTPMLENAAPLGYTHLCPLTITHEMHHNESDPIGTTTNNHLREKENHFQTSRLRDEAESERSKESGQILSAQKSVENSKDQYHIHRCIDDPNVQSIWNILNKPPPVEQKLQKRQLHRLSHDLVDRSKRARINEEMQRPRQSFSSQSLLITFKLPPEFLMGLSETAAEEKCA